MKETRIINRILTGAGMFVLFLLLCSGMEEFSTLQFVTAKVIIVIMMAALAGHMKHLNQENRL